MSPELLAARLAFRDCYCRHAVRGDSRVALLKALYEQYLAAGGTLSQQNLTAVCGSR